MLRRTDMTPGTPSRLPGFTAEIALDARETPFRAASNVALDGRQVVLQVTCEQISWNPLRYMCCELWGGDEVCYFVPESHNQF
jgi:hypothetical protein